jgi:hypothetical protein
VAAREVLGLQLILSLMVGIGTSSSAKANAITVLKNGNVGIGTASSSTALTVIRQRLGGGVGTNGIGLAVAGNWYTDTSSSGTMPSNMVNSFLTPTLAASNATTYTNAATLYIQGAPMAGSNATLTNPYALYVSSGTAFFGENVKIGGTITSGTWNGGTIGITYGGTGATSFTTQNVPVIYNGTALVSTARSGSTTTFVTTTGTLTSGHCVKIDVNGNMVDAGSACGGSGAAGGSNTQIQYNNTGSFGGARNFVWNSTSNFLGLGRATASAQLHIAGANAVSAPAWTTNGIGLRQDAQNYTDSSTAAGATVASNYVDALAQPTVTAGNATSGSKVTYTNAATLAIANAPAAGTNTLITNPLAFYVAAGTSSFGGNVGIGTTNPQELLSLRYNGSSVNALSITNTETNGRYWVIGDDAGSTGSPGTLAIVDYTASPNTARLVINSTGNVGIGTTSPQTMLDIYGGSGTSLNGQYFQYSQNFSVPVSQGNYTEFFDAQSWDEAFNLQVDIIENNYMHYSEHYEISLNFDDGNVSTDTVYRVLGQWGNGS